VGNASQRRHLSAALLPTAVPEQRLCPRWLIGAPAPMTSLRSPWLCPHSPICVVSALWASLYCDLSWSVSRPSTQLPLSYFVLLSRPP
jgi:hypothetical protein